MVKKKNPWLVHLAKCRKDNPKVKDVKQLAKLARKSYQAGK